MTNHISRRRWHKPKDNGTHPQQVKFNNNNNSFSNKNSYEEEDSEDIDVGQENLDVSLPDRREDSLGSSHFPGDGELETNHSDPQSTYSIARLLNSSSSSPVFSGLQCEVSDALQPSQPSPHLSSPLPRFVIELSSLWPVWSPTEPWCTLPPSPAGCAVRPCTPCQASQDTSTKLTQTSQPPTVIK